MSVSQELLRFIRAHRGELTLSVYIEATPADPAERRNWRVHLRQQVAQARDALAGAPQEERDAFERCVERALDHLPTDQAMPRGGSWACFCAAGGDQLTLALPEGVETSVHWGIGALVVPYLRVAETEEAHVVQVDRNHVRISRLHDGAFETLLAQDADAITEIGPYMSEPARVGFHGGTRGRTGTDEVQRQRREATERLHAVLLHRLTALADGGIPLVVGGAPESAAHLLRMLPPALAGHAALSPVLRMQSPAEALGPIREALHTLRSRHQESRVDAIREAAHATGRAALGYEGTARAAELGAIAELIFSESAWRQHPKEIEQLVQRALADGAEVAWADASLKRALDGEADGIVAGLRFPLAAAQ